jgi:hypothetical protein
MGRRRSRRESGTRGNWLGFLFLFLLFMAFTGAWGAVWNLIGLLVVGAIVVGIIRAISQASGSNLDEIGEWFQTQFANSQSGAAGDDYAYEEAAERIPEKSPLYPQARAAVQRAGLDPESTRVLPMDIGLMVFKNGKDPEVQRRLWLPDDADYVQPFIELRLPMEVRGRVRFEILDGGGTPRFVHEDHFQFTRGRNFLTPAARLPVHDQWDMDGSWHLRVYGDDVLLADHIFSFEDSTSATVRQHIGADGELTSEMRAVLQENRLPRMSIDELLDDEDEAEAAPAASQQASAGQG